MLRLEPENPFRSLQSDVERETCEVQPSMFAPRSSSLQPISEQAGGMGF